MKAIYQTALDIAADRFYSRRIREYWSAEQAEAELVRYEVLCATIMARMAA